MEMLDGKMHSNVAANCSFGACWFSWVCKVLVTKVSCGSCIQTRDIYLFLEMGLDTRYFCQDQFLYKHLNSRIAWIPSSVHLIDARLHLCTSTCLHGTLNHATPNRITLFLWQDALYCFRSACLWK